MDPADLTISADERNREDSRIIFQDRMREDPDIAPVPGASGAVVGGAERRSNRAGKCFRYLRFGPGFTRILFLSLSDNDSGDAGGMIGELGEGSIWTCRYSDGVGPLLRRPVAKIARKDTLLGDAITQVGATEQAAERFGPLKVILGAIPAVYANLEVCIRLCAQNPPLTSAFAGNWSRKQRGRRPSFARGCTREMF